eukprot:5005385-Alexandrium_andersonii.AAC.1
MSASLVGSEMCIRDRCACVCVCVFPPGCPPQGGQGSVQQSALVTAGSFAAVSYTHLTLPTICSV